MRKLVMAIILMIFSTVSIFPLSSSDEDIHAALSCTSTWYGGARKDMCHGVCYAWVNEYASQTKWEGSSWTSIAAVKRNDGAYERRVDYDGYTARADLYYNKKGAKYYHN